jgi:hypothetical protein
MIALSASTRHRHECLQNVAQVGWQTHLLPFMQDKCSILQVNHFASCVGGASVSLVRCTGHQGVMHLESEAEYNIKTVKGTECGGCQECRQPVPLVIPEGTGGNGCSAEVAAKATALHDALYRGGEPANADGGGTQSGTAANSALVECAVCRRKPGDPGVPATLKLCGGCLYVRYCSAECQRKDWKMGHKDLCKHGSRHKEAYPER